MKPDGSQSDISWIDPAAYNWWLENNKSFMANMIVYGFWKDNKTSVEIQSCDPHLQRLSSDHHHGFKSSTVIKKDKNPNN
jgi:hypothetical protein